MMDSSRELLLEIWRESCRHIEIKQSVNQLVALLCQVMPVEMLVLRRFDFSAKAIDTVAVGQQRPGPEPADQQMKFTPDRWSRLIAWGAEGKLLQSAGIRRSGELALLSPKDLGGDLLAGPLNSQNGLTGVMILAADHGRVFKPEHLALVAEFLEPFSVALENDRRLSELTALRDAAVADRRNLLKQLATKTNEEEPVVGAETGLRTVMERVKLVAPSDAPVLILGDTGTGKEVIARAIHVRSKRVDGPFIRVNCGAIPSELIDSQLFGHERGSFTGAEGTRQGWFERADEGTLFLDEIGELPLIAQVRLLRVLQDGFIERVGGHEVIRVNVRLIAATHRDLAAMVHQGKFREDLWYRVNVFPLLLPRLAERPEDIPALARHFAKRASNRFGLSHVDPTADDFRLLAQYPWPGNIRELGAVMDRAVLLGEGQRLDVAKSLGISLPRHRPPIDEPTFYEVIPESDYERPRVNLDLNASASIALDDVIKRHIEQVLGATRGKVEGRRGAAERLEINPHTLRAKMRKLGIDWSRYREMQ